MKVNAHIQTDLLFDGYCPACLLKGEQVDMQLNEWDFWQCLNAQCGIQITTFAPFAAILLWKGKGVKMKGYEYLAWNHYQGLLLTRANREKGKEIFPDEKGIFRDSFDLEAYIGTLYENEEAYHQSIKELDYALKQQAQHLDKIGDEEWENLVELYKIVKKEGLETVTFTELQQMLYDLGVIYCFDWQLWYDSYSLTSKPKAHYATLSLLDISSLLTYIIRYDRFTEGMLKRTFEEGILDRLFERLEEIT